MSALFFPVKTFANDFEINSKGVLVKYHGSDSHVVIPKGVKHIGHGAFGFCFNLENIEIPSSVKTIDTGAFIYCHNPNPAIPEGVPYNESNLYDISIKQASNRLLRPEAEIENILSLYEMVWLDDRIRLYEVLRSKNGRDEVISFVQDYLNELPKTPLEKIYEWRNLKKYEGK